MSAAHGIHSDYCLQSQFGLPETLYDFQGIDAEVLKNKCDELEASTKGMKKKINPKVMSMIDRYFFCINKRFLALKCSPSSVEKKEVELKKNMAIVEKDKLKIEETIAELDRYKREALEKTWEKVTTYVHVFCALALTHFLQ